MGKINTIGNWTRRRRD